MKKIIILVFIISVFFLQSCDKDKETDSNLPSEEENILEIYFKGLESLDNFTLEIDVSYLHENYNIIVKSNTNKSSIQNENILEYFEKDGQKCYYYFKHSDGFSKELIPCSSESNQMSLFFKSLKASWFSEHNQRYFLNFQNFKDVEPFFQSEFPNGKISNFEIIFTDELIDQMIFDLTVGTTTYQLTMTLKNINTTEIDLPNVS